MLKKEFIQMRRDRLTFALMVGIPVIQLVLFGYAIRTEVRHLPTVVLDESRSSESRSLVSVMEQTQNFRIAGQASSRAQVRDWIESGRAKAAIIIPPDFHTDLKRQRTAQAQVIVDAADPLASAAAIGGAALAASVRATAIADRGASRPPPLEVRVRPWYNPALRSSIYIVPGIIGVLLSLTLLAITSIAIVREREHGTFEQLVVTPVSKSAIMLGKLLPFVLVGYVQMTSILILGRILFGVPIRGSIVLLYVLSLGFIVANLGIGLLVSTLVKTQIQAIQLSILLLMPNILLSGFMFPLEAMPVVAQWIALALPLTYYLTILRGILLKGVGINYLWHETLILAGFAAVLILISVRRFSKTVG
ncbi:MAG TPA: ABC transporter permease [Gemmatimonadaceae bacterium]|nr:ABC transporter permease [Gemmatimonadaceae bacterium]